MPPARRAASGLMLVAAAVSLAACDQLRERAGMPNRQAAGPAGTRLTDTAAQVALGVGHILTAGGARRGELRADTAVFNDDGTEAELRRVTITFFTLTGDTTGTATAPAASYDMAAGVVRARGGVTVQSRDGRQLTSARISYDVRTSQLRGDTAWTLSGSGGARSGTAFESDQGLRAVRQPVARDTSKPAPARPPR